METLGDIPDSDLVEAARHARLTCDHPAKIVPAIFSFLNPDDGDDEEFMGPC